jgi:hypothetical protein
MNSVTRSLLVVVAFGLGCAARPDPKQMARFEDLSRTFNPTYCVYTLGALQIRKLRDDVAREQGKGFDLARFHATILSQGSLPVALLRRMLLRSEGSIL